MLLFIGRRTRLAQKAERCVGRLWTDGRRPDQVAGPRQSTREYPLVCTEPTVRGNAVLAVRILAAQAEALEALAVDEVAHAEQREAHDGRRDLVGPERLR